MRSLDHLGARSTSLESKSRASARRSRARRGSGAWWRRTRVAASLSACVALAVVVTMTRTRARWSFAREPVETVERETVRMEDVCVYSPSTTERARTALPRLASTWRGTISIAVLANVSDPREVMGIAKSLGDVEGDRNRVVVTVVEDLPEFGAGARFPVNYLRNVAKAKCVDELNATYVLVHDVDFEVFTTPGFLADVRRVLTPGARRALVVPAFELHTVWSKRLNVKRDEILRARLSEKRHGLNGSFQNYYDVDALVDDLDASSSPMRLFEMLVKRDQTSRRGDDVDARTLNLTLPYSTKEKLRRLVFERRLASGFQTKYWSVAHGPTNYTAFWEDDTAGTYRVFDRANDRHPWYFEPYVVLRVDELIDFDESFVAYGFNKIAWITELAAIGFEFYSTRNAWVVHTNTHRTRATARLKGDDLAKCRAHPASSTDFRLARIGHSCIPAFLRRLECAYGFSVAANVSFNNVEVQNDVRFRLESDDNIVCFAGCLTDLEDATRTPSAVTIRGGRFVDVAPGSDARRRKRGLCQRFDNLLKQE